MKQARSRFGLIAASVLLGLGILSLTMYWLTRPSSLCAFAAGGKIGTVRHVRITAMLYGNANGTLELNDAACGPQSNAWATVQPEPALATDEQLNSFLAIASQLGTGDEHPVAQVTIVGMLEDLGNPSFAARFNLRATEIEFLTPVSVTSVPATVGQASPNGAVQQAIAAERAHLVLIDTLTAVARAR